MWSPVTLAIDASDGGKFLMSGADAGSAGGAWRNSGISAATGYTVETRLKITAASGTAGAIVVNVSAQHFQLSGAQGMTDGEGGLGDSGVGHGDVALILPQCLSAVGIGEGQVGVYSRAGLADRGCGFFRGEADATEGKPAGGIGHGHALGEDQW